MSDLMPQWPLNVLIFSSDPRNERRLRLGQEHRDLQTAIRATNYATQLHVVNEPSCRYSDITATLDRIDPNILHFSGHGGEDVLYFEDESGSAKPVRKQALAGILSQQCRLKLVILNACFSLQEGQAFANAVGLAIVAEGSILDQDAIDFSREFYTALGQGQRSYVGAFERARFAVAMTGNMRVHLLQRETLNTQGVLMLQGRGQTNLSINQVQQGGSISSLSSPTEPTTTSALTAVTVAGAALLNAIKLSATRRSAIPLIVQFEDAMLWEMQQHSTSASWANQSNVKFYCNSHMNSDPIAQSIWDSMIRALEKSMERVKLVNSSLSKDQLFGGFDGNALRRIR